MRKKKYRILQLCSLLCSLSTGNYVKPASLLPRARAKPRFTPERACSAPRASTPPRPSARCAVRKHTRHERRIRGRCARAAAAAASPSPLDATQLQTVASFGRGFFCALCLVRARAELSKVRRPALLTKTRAAKRSRGRRYHGAHLRRWFCAQLKLSRAVRVLRLVDEHCGSGCRQRDVY